MLNLTILMIALGLLNNIEYVDAGNITYYL